VKAKRTITFGEIAQIAIGAKLYCRLEHCRF